jgi:hypothetical protein
MLGGTDASKHNDAVRYSNITSTSPASAYYGVNETISYGDSTILGNSAGIVDTVTRGYVMLLGRPTHVILLGHYTPLHSHRCLQGLRLCCRGHYGLDYWASHDHTSAVRSPPAAQL